MDIPFLRPRLVALADYAHLIEQIDASRIYSELRPVEHTRFERRVVAEHFDGVGTAATVCNATLGLMLAIQAVKRPGRYAVMPSFTFAATPLAAQWCGLEPYFVDVGADWCVDPLQLREALAHLGDAVAVVLPYATFGTALELTPYAALIERGMPVVVDAAPALGTRCAEHGFGVGFRGPIVYSLHATKTFGIGEGGLVYSGDDGIVRKVKTLSNFGFDAGRASTLTGLNAKLSEYGAAVALATLNGHAERVALRRDLYGEYAANFHQLGLFTAGWQLQALRGEVAHRFVPAATPSGLTNTKAIAGLASKSIEARTYFSPACHTQPQFAAAPRASLSVTDDLAHRIVSLPLWDDIGAQRIRRVCEALATVC